MGEPRDPLHCTRNSVHGRVSMSYVKIDTDLGVFLHHQCSTTCLHTPCIEPYVEFEVDLWS
jgi:hypothetical protein